MSAPPSEALAGWLTEHAGALDVGTADPEAVLGALGADGLFRVGAPREQGGLGGTVRDAVRSLAAVAERSLTAAFVLWGQRTFVEYLLATPNEAARRRWLQPVLSGELAGATGLSNAIKFLSGIEELQAQLTPRTGGTSLDGKAPWATNLRKGGFVVAVTARAPGGDGAWVLAVPGDVPGVARSADLRLLGLQSSNTAALSFQGAELGDEHVLHRDAREFIAAVRPAFLGLQCGLSIGLSRASLRAAAEAARVDFLHELAAELSRELEEAAATLDAGLADARFLQDAPALFALRVALARLAQQAVELELRASGGGAYLTERDRGFARRWREAAFLPIVTPSLVQLEQELRRSRAVAAA